MRELAVYEGKKRGRPRIPGKEYNTSRNPDGRRIIEKPVAITPEGKKIMAYNDDGKPICNSKRGGKDARCNSVFTMMNGRCKLHGGKAPSGIMHHLATDLRTASIMPSHLQSDMLAAMRDENKLSLDHEISLIDVSIAQQKKAMELGLGSSAWKKLYELANALEHQLENNSPRSEQTCEDLINVIRQGGKEREIWKEVNNSVEVRRKLVETAHKREMNLKSMLKGEQALALMTGIASNCKEQIAKTFLNLETKYRLIDRDTGVEVTKIDIGFRNDFLSSISIGLSRLISKPDPNRDIPIAE